MQDSDTILPGCTDEEEAFFRAGFAPTTLQPVETFADLDEGYRPIPVLQRLLGRQRPATR